jgi:nicotinate-nucleotide adenylyltransferase
MTEKKKIGIMGGTFDPIHLGHLILGEVAYRQLDLDQVLYMPAGNPPHKRNRTGRASDEDRVQMIRLAIAGNPHFALSLFDMREEGYSYTYRLLEALNSEYSDCEFYFIMGADSLVDFDTWMNPQRIANAARLVVATRNQMSNDSFEALLQKRREQYHGDFLRLDTPNLDISSQHLRELVGSGASVKYYVPDPVLDYIREHSLYRISE